MATQVTLNSGSVDSAGSLALKTNGTTTAVTIGTDQSVNFAATGQRITGDFSNATVANRVAFQTSTANGNTGVYFLPNGTATTSNVIVSNASDPTNSALGILGAISSDIRISSAISGTGTYLPLTFYTGGSERVRVDTSGNVGIGTSSPTAKLHVSGDALANTFKLIANTTVSGSDATIFRPADNTLAFSTNGAERMRIDSSGGIGIRATSIDTNYLLQVGDQSTDGRAPIKCEVATTAARTQIGFRNSSGVVGSISTNGSTTSYNTSSDYRLKNTIAPMTGALAKVALLKPCTYKWRVDGSDGQGFIAHELAEVVPQCVTGEKDAVDDEGNPQYQGIDTSFLVATLTAAIQEQQAIITQLQADVEALKGTA